MSAVVTVRLAFAAARQEYGAHWNAISESQQWEAIYVITRRIETAVALRKSLCAPFRRRREDRISD
jgi:hypothetical protein